MSVKISGEKYAMMYGPTTGDKVRLADTSLVVEVEKDYTTYGDEVKFGGGKTIRDGMGCDCGNIPVECNTYISDRISKRSTLVFDDDGRVQKLQVLF